MSATQVIRLSSFKADPTIGARFRDAVLDAGGELVATYGMPSADTGEWELYCEYWLDEEDAQRLPWQYWGQVLTLPPTAPALVEPYNNHLSNGDEA